MYTKLMVITIICSIFLCILLAVYISSFMFTQRESTTASTQTDMYRPILEL